MVESTLKPSQPKQLPAHHRMERREEMCLMFLSQKLRLVVPKLVLTDVNSKDVPLLFALLVSVVPMVLNVKWTGVLLVFNLMLGVKWMDVLPDVLPLAVLVVPVMSISPYANIVVHSKRDFTMN